MSASGKMSKKVKLKKMMTGDQPALLDKTAAKMVEQVRLQTIEKENRSAGALLDTRTLHKLEEPKVGLNNKAKAKLDTQKRVESRRMARAEEELKKQSESAINKMMAKGVDIVKTSNFENEELIWATKSSDPNYSKKRRFEDPALQSFKNGLTLDERRLFKSLCHQALVDLATKYREEIEEVRSDMDLAGVFHPDANAHRAHCMYLMKLYAGIRADTIEDPVLRKIRADKLAAELKREEEERKQRELIASYESKNRKVNKTGGGVAEAMAKAEAEEEERKKAIEDKQTKELERLRAKMEEEKKRELDRERKRQARLGGGKSKPKKIVQPPLKKAKQLPAINSAAATQQSSGDDAASTAEETTGSGSTANEADPLKGMAANDAKLFSKMKRGRMGGVDPRTLLQSEAARLDESEVIDKRKIKERSTLVDENTTKWMLQLLQESQIHKTSEGRELAPAAKALMPSDTFGGTINSPNKTLAQKDDPQRVIPFNEFYDMFKEYSENANADEALRAIAKEEDERAIPQTPKDGWVPGENDFGSNVGLEESLPGWDLPSVPSVNAEKVRPTDTLQELAEVDPHFEAYMKMSRRQQPQGQRLFRGKISKQSKRRPHNPLGSKAVNMTDSKGAATEDARKGFTNIFNMRVAEDESSEEEEEPENAFLSNNDKNDDLSLEGDDAGSPTHTTDRPDTPYEEPATVTVKATVQTSQLGSPGRPGSRSKRGSSRQSSRQGNRTRGGKMASVDNEEGKDLQAKLMAAFDCLQTPALSRLAFMRMYAQSKNACNFNKAIDKTAEAAVLALARTELVHKNKVKLREGLAVLPLVAQNLLPPLMENVPPLLSSSSPALCVLESFDAKMGDPASVKALKALDKVVTEIFPNDRVEDTAHNAMTVETAEELLSELEEKIESMLYNLDESMSETLGDRLQVQGKDLKDWLARFRPKMKAEAKEEEGKSGEEKK